MRWLKIKLTDKDPATVEIGYQMAVSGGYTDHLVTSPEAPHPDFVNAMTAVAPAVLKIAELEGVAELDDITVRSVSLGHKKEGKTSVIITALRQLKNSRGPLLINTPLKYIVADDAGGDDVNDILCGEARAFIEDGKRAQGDLFQKREQKQNGRRPRAEDGYQGEQPELQMDPIGETVGAVMEGLNQLETGNVAPEDDSSPAEGDALVPATSTETAAVEEIMSIAHGTDVLDIPVQNSGSNGDLAAAFDGLNLPPHANGDQPIAGHQTEALNNVQNWLDYKEYCFTFGLKCAKADFDALKASRDPSEVRAGYRDAQLANEREQRRKSARTVLENGGVAGDDDLLGD
jgi:hypothetical protein